MANSPKRDKDDAYWKILNAALELDVKKGHLKWTLSDLSRKSRITRSLIYYYFGRSKIGILEEAIKLIGEELVGLNRDRLKMWQEGDLVRSMRETRVLREKAPYICNFVLEHRDLENEIGVSIRKIEKGFLAKLENFFPNSSAEEKIGIFAVYWGLTFAPYVTDESMVAVVSIIKERMDRSKEKGAIERQL